MYIVGLLHLLNASSRGSTPMKDITWLMYPVDFESRTIPHREVYPCLKDQSDGITPKAAALMRHQSLKEPGNSIVVVMKIMKDEYSFIPSYVPLSILHRKFVSISFHAALSKLFAFAGGASTHPSSIIGGVSTRGQAEAERKRTRL
jgi:hypothetical protein